MNKKVKFGERRCNWRGKEISTNFLIWGFNVRKTWI